MKGKLKKLGAIGLLCVMLVGMGITANATPHTCAYSYMGNEMYNTVEGPDHPYYVYENGKMETKSCHITYLYYRQVYKCACGNIEYRNPWTVTKHSADCGQ